MGTTDIRTYDISADMFDCCAEYSSVAIDTETRSDNPNNPTGALDPWRGHISLVTVHQPTINKTEFVRMRIRDTQGGVAQPIRLERLIRSTRVVKIFHHALFDLRFLKTNYGMDSEAAFCTKVAEKILHPNITEKGFYSLVGLVKRYKGIDMEKGYALSDWEAPNLAPEQLQYALEDVIHLTDIFVEQSRILTQDAKLDAVSHRAFMFLSTLVALEIDYGATSIYSY